MLPGFWTEEPLRRVSAPVIKPSSRHTEPQSPNDNPTPQVRRFDSGSSGESDSVPQRGGSFSREITVCWAVTTPMWPVQVCSLHHVRCAEVCPVLDRVGPAAVSWNQSGSRDWEQAASDYQFNQVSILTGNLWIILFSSQTRNVLSLAGI